MPNHKRCSHYKCKHDARHVVKLGARNNELGKTHDCCRVSHCNSRPNYKKLIKR